VPTAVALPVGSCILLLRPCVPGQRDNKDAINTADSHRLSDCFGAHSDLSPTSRDFPIRATSGREPSQQKLLDRLSADACKTNGTVRPLPSSADCISLDTISTPIKRSKIAPTTSRGNQQGPIATKPNAIMVVRIAA
jgi:hypothetical protein